MPDYDRCESCTIADMVALALKLSVAGAGDYWDDADRWTRNHFTESQLTSADWVYRLAERSPRKPVAWNETGDHVPERNIGAFAGWSTGNDFNVESPDHTMLDPALLHRELAADALLHLGAHGELRPGEAASEPAVEPGLGVGGHLQPYSVPG